VVEVVVEQELLEQPIFPLLRVVPPYQAGPGGVGSFVVQTGFGGCNGTTGPVCGARYFSGGGGGGRRGTAPSGAAGVGGSGGGGAGTLGDSASNAYAGTANTGGGGGGITVHLLLLVLLVDQEVLAVQESL
jgi:hypothetical protein